MLGRPNRIDYFFGSSIPISLKRAPIDSEHINESPSDQGGQCTICMLSLASLTENSSSNLLTATRMSS
jgi:hypothetical protein